ncbi:MAG: hypothetical protein KKE23_02210 [Nanoarchaeota archaeon]|nr:hypothetical protein [Nanoarchaeota archaeon]
MGEIDDLIPKINPRYSEGGKKGPIWENKIYFDTNMNTLENFYYWIIDFMNGYYSGPENVEKIADTFVTSPGSSYFGNLSMTAQKMQEEGMKILGTVNNVIKSLINIIYDLRNFDIRLKVYDKLKDPKTKKEGMLALKELWLMSVDMQRQSGSINYMAQNYGFTTLRPAFFAAESVEEAEKMDLTEIVRRTLISRLGEFFTWIEFSEIELRKRYEIEKSQLRSQIDTVKLYSSWVKPYLQAAEQLRMKGSKEASIVSIFTSMILELNLFAKKKADTKGAVFAGDLPQGFIKKLDDIRDFYEVLTVDFKFRTYPTAQHPHAGRIEIGFKAYVLNEDELLLLEKIREDGAIESTLNVAGHLTDKSLEQIQKDIDYFLEPKEEKKEEEEYFLKELWTDIKKSIVGQSRLEKEKEEKEKSAKEKKEKSEKKLKLKEEGISEDNYEEDVVRQLVENESAKSCFTLFDTFKKTQGLSSFPSPFDDPDFVKRIRARIAEVKASNVK